MAKPPPLRKRRYGWAVWLVALAGIALAAHRALGARKKPALSVRVQRVERGAVRDLVSSVGAGRVAAHREVTLRAEVAGIVRTLHHRRGERVQAGEALVSYDERELRDRLRIAQASVALSRAQAAQAAASARVARASAQRARALADRGVTPPAEAEGVEGQFDVASRAEAAARTALEQGAANVQLARDALSHAVLRAPFAGVVLATTVEEGEVTAPGAPLVSLADVSEMHVDAELDESDLGRVAVGMPAEVSLDAYPGARFPGTLGEIAPSVTRDVRGNRSVAVRVDLSPDARLRVGMSADVDVVVARRENAVWVPPNAVMGRGTDRAVFVAEGGVARRRPIDVGVATWEAVEVLRGVSPGQDVIVTLSSADLADGVPVQVARAVATEAAGAGGAPR